MEHRLLSVALGVMVALALPALAKAETSAVKLSSKAPRKPEITGSIGPSNAKPSNFTACLQGFWSLAAAKGVSRATFTDATAGVTQDDKILALTRKQAEFSRPIWDYLASAASAARIGNGRAQAEAHSTELAALEKKYGVDEQVIMGVWGMETNFGANTGGTYVIRALATLACARYRGTFFRDELVTALEILEQGHVDRDAMRGSWAGAMGQTQFMPSSFMKYAVDYDGDGHKDIWTSIPDALASTANYLSKHGWIRGLPWGFEVQLPDGFNVNHHARSVYSSFGAWGQLGVTRSDGEALPGHGEAALFLPAGAHGPAFLITRNFAVIKTYNNSDSYALGVSHLGDRIYGGGTIQAAWPRGQQPLLHPERIEIQKRLTSIGYDVGKHDGHLGEKASEAIRAFQLKSGMVADGYPTKTILARLKAYPH